MNIERMRQLKAERGYSNAQISELSGVPVGTVQKIFSGITETPRYETLQALKKIFQDTEDLRPSDMPYSPHSESTMQVSESLVPYLTKRQGEYTIEDCEKLPEDHRVELIDGIIYDMTAPSNLHQIIQGELFAALWTYIKKNQGSCRAMTAPSDVRLNRDNRTMVEPDIYVVCDRSRFNQKYTDGAPDLVIEILSPSTRTKDLFIKGAKYTSAGVREYWIVDPEKLRVTVHVIHSEEDIDTALYTFRDKVPVAIFDNRCVIDFAEVYEEIRFLYEKDE